MVHHITPLQTSKVRLYTFWIISPNFNPTFLWSHISLRSWFSGWPQQPRANCLEALKVWQSTGLRQDFNSYFLVISHFTRRLFISHSLKAELSSICGRCFQHSSSLAGLSSSSTILTCQRAWFICVCVCVCVCVCFCVLSHWVHAAIFEVPHLPSLKCSSHWSLGLYPASVEIVLFYFRHLVFQASSGLLLYCNDAVVCLVTIRF